jgi:glycosyltransferase involved in cell wall biosynthesis
MQDIASRTEISKSNGTITGKIVGWQNEGMHSSNTSVALIGTEESRCSPKHRIRVLHSVGHLLRGGIEMWLYQMVRKLDSSQFEHHILVRTDKEEAFTELFRKAGAHIVACPDYKRPLKYASNFRRAIADNGPYDILHVHGSNPNGLIALALAKSVGIRATIIHSHNDVRPLIESRGIVYRSYVGITLHCLRLFADRGFAASVLAAESMFGPLWRENNRWKLLYYGVDFNPFAGKPDLNLRTNLGIPKGAFIIGHVGRFHEQKNHEFLVRIAEELNRKCRDAHFLFIGDGELRSGIASELERKCLSHKVTFVPDTLSVPNFMISAMDCFVFPSRYEGLGLVAVEAQAAGLPCLLSDRVPKEAIVDQTLVKVLSLEDSPEVWVDAIMNLRGQKIRREQQLTHFFRSAFNLEECAASLATTYRSLAA